MWKNILNNDKLTLRGEAMKKVFYSLLAMLLLLSITGCGNKKEEEVKNITLKCNKVDSEAYQDDEDMESVTETVEMEFNENQEVIKYTSYEIMKMSDSYDLDAFKEEVEESKKLYEESLSDDNIKYELTSDNDKREVTLKITTTNIEKDEDDPESILLRRLREFYTEEGYTCSLEGLDESNIK